MLPLPEEGYEDQHDCVGMLEGAEGAAAAAEKPLPNPDLILFMDGSSSVEHGIRKAGWAVTTLHEVVRKGGLPAGTSARQAELRALAEACRVAEGQTANIYTDSRYAFGVAHDFGQLWRKRGFLTAAGTPIRNGMEVCDLLEALLLPEEVSILKCKAHTKENTDEAKGNTWADQAAKEAALMEPEKGTLVCQLGT
uniref:ribonuclease H-like n=1 Tax=Pristiophorus japonicus TaxID=55135 RepID=UPI00398F39D0